MPEIFHYNVDTRKYAERMLNFCRYFGVNLNLENPVTIQDKLAWLNIYDESPLKVKCADKVKLHEYCKDVLGEDICIPIIKIYNNTDEINFDELPEKFVMKCNHGSGMNIIVTDKTKLDKSKAIETLNRWMNDNYAFRNGFEAHYNDIERKIFVEEFKGDGKVSLIDYKFSCFNGKPIFMQLISNRFDSAKHMNYYDLDFNLLPYERTDFKTDRVVVHEKPKTFKQMKDIAEKLSKPFKYVRVDLYEIDDKVCLGELTFTPNECAIKYVNPEDSITIGKLLSLE